MKWLLLVHLLFGSSVLLHGQEDVILDLIFTDDVIESDLYFDPVQNLDQLGGLYQDYFVFSVEDFNQSYENSEILSSSFVEDTLNFISFELNGKESQAVNYVLKSDIASNTVFYIIPGSGNNQSEPIYHGNANYHNKNYNISEYCKSIGDVFVQVKPNEDYLAVTRNGKKANVNAVHAHLLMIDKPFAANYLTHAVVTIKQLKQSYENVIVMGVSQGGLATLLVSLLSEPDAAVVASGYSIYFDQVYYAGIDQIHLPGIDTFLNKEIVKNTVASSDTKFLFTWGLNEKGYYKVENENLTTYTFLSDLSNVTYAIDHNGHTFPNMFAIDSLLHYELGLDLILETSNTRSALYNDDINLEEYKLYPNPTSGNIELNFGTRANREIEIHDINGNIIVRQVSVEDRIILQTQSLDMGNYLVTVRNRSTSESKVYKFIRN